MKPQYVAESLFKLPSVNHGVYLSGGEVALKDCVIQDPLACAIRNKGGKLTAENLTTKNTPAAAITNAWNDNKTDYGDISIDGLTTVWSTFNG